MDRAWVLCVLVVFFVSKGEAIKCFQCSSVEPGCAELKKNDTQSPFYKECEPNKKFCRKTVHTILDNDRFVRVTRECGWEMFKGAEDNCYQNDDDFKYEKSCQCFEDGCNSGINLGVNTLLLIPFLFLLYRNF